MITLTNPLTAEERQSTFGLHGHDLLGRSQVASSNIEVMLELGKSEEGILARSRATANLNHLIYTTLAIERLHRRELLLLDDIGYVDIRKIAENFLHVLPGENHNQAILVHSSNPREIEFATEKSLLWPVLFNLVKNARKHSPTNEVYVSIEPHEKFPENACFVPEGARAYSHFVGLHVHNAGPGFPPREQRDYADYFNRRPAILGIGRQGFGLYFTGLVSKVLRAPIEIKSVPGDTTVSFYHPRFE